MSEDGVHWRHERPAEVRRRTAKIRGSPKYIISKTVLKVLGMVMTAYVTIVIEGERPKHEKKTMLRIWDNTSAVQWLQTCRGGKTRSGALMKILGIEEKREGWSVQTAHVKDVENVIERGITR